MFWPLKLLEAVQNTENMYIPNLGAWVTMNCNPSYVFIDKSGISITTVNDTYIMWQRYKQGTIIRNYGMKTHHQIVLALMINHIPKRFGLPTDFLGLPKMVTQVDNFKLPPDNGDGPVCQALVIDEGKRSLRPAQCCSRSLQGHDLVYNSLGSWNACQGKW